LLHDPGQPRGLALGQPENEPSQRRGVHHRMAKRMPKPPADQVAVESIVAVLDKYPTPSEVEESSARIRESWSAGKHVVADPVPTVRVCVDGCPAVNQGVEQGEGLVEPKPLCPDLEDQERGVAGRLDVQSYELGVVQRCLGANHRTRRLLLALPQDRGLCPARLQVDAQYAFLCVQTLAAVISMILRSKTGFQFSM
jgi:hypothetical protein